MKQGIYVGAAPIALASGKPVKRGDTVVVDSAGEDAYLLDQLASVSDAKPARAPRQRRPRATKQQEHSE